MEGHRRRRRKRETTSDMEIRRNNRCMGFLIGSVLVRQSLFKSFSFGDCSAILSSRVDKIYLEYVQTSASRSDIQEVNSLQCTIQTTFQQHFSTFQLSNVTRVNLADLCILQHATLDGTVRTEYLTTTTRPSREHLFWIQHGGNQAACGW